MRADEKRRGPNLSQPAVFLIAFVVLALLVFRDVILSGGILFSTDDNIGALALLKSQLPQAFLGRWDDSILLGTVNMASLSWTNLLLWLLPVDFFTNWIHAFDLVVGSFFLALFLHEKKMHPAATALAALTAYWLGSTFTLTYAGHIGKFGVVLFAGLYLWLVERAICRRSPAYAALAGGALGMMFLEQADVALFFALMLGPYAIVAIARERGKAWREYPRILVPLILLAALFAFRPAWSSYTFFAAPQTGAAAISKESTAEKWAFTTQWSWPPEESIDFIAPGFMGWRSGEPEGPYTGRMGRSEGWEQTQQGFQNFKLENQYLGAIPLFFALFAGLLAWRRFRRGDPAGWDMLFWTVASLFALLLAFGKYFPLYRVFYALPFLSSIRNPNKFLQVFQFALGILAAYGLDETLRFDPKRHLEARPVFYTALAVGGLLLLWGLGSLASLDALARGLSQKGWGRAADVIAHNRIWALLHGGVMCLLFAGALKGLQSNWNRKHWIPWALVAVVVFDVLFLARFYVQTIPHEAVAENGVVRVLKADERDHRAITVTQEGFYNLWLTYLFPYHGIRTLNVTQMPRMPEDYRRFLSALRQNPPRFWELGAAAYILGPSALWSQIENDPALRDRYELVYAYNVEPITAGVRVVPATEQQPGQHVVAHALSPAPRYALISGWRAVADDEALRLLTDPSFAPFTSVLLAPGQAGDLPDTPPGRIVGSVERQSYRAGHIQLRTSSDVPAILRLSEKYDPNWTAELDGKKVPLLRTDFITMGIHVLPGVHEVIFRYAPPTGSLAVQGAGMLICLSLVGALFRRRFVTGE